MLIDLHVYTEPSGGPSLDQQLKNAAKLGLDAILVADQGASADAARRAVEAAEQESGGDVKLFVGVEIATLSGDVIFVPSELDPFLTCEEWRQLSVLGIPSLAEVRDVISEIDGVLLGVHPYDRERKSAPRDRMFAHEGFAAWEIWTGSASKGANDLAFEAVAHGRTPAFAGSADKRSRGASNPWVTLLGEAVSTQAELVEVLKKGELWPVELASGGGGGRGSSKGRGGRRPRR